MRPLVAAALLVGLGLAIALAGCGASPDPASVVVGTWILREDPPARGWAELTFFADGTYEGKDARWLSSGAERIDPVTVAHGVWTSDGREIRTTGRTRNGKPLAADDPAARVTLVRRGESLRPRAPDGSLGPPFRRK